MRTGYDAIASLSGNIPTDAQVVMGYVSPSGFAWSSADWARFPNSVIVRITPQVTHVGLGIHVLDVEQGDATSAQAPGWAHTQRSLGQIPTVYCSASRWQEVQDAFITAGEPQPLYWIAAYPGTGQNLPALNGITAIAHQYADPGPYDISVVADYWPGVDQGGPVTAPDPWAELVIDPSTGQPAKDINGQPFTYGQSYAFVQKEFWADDKVINSLPAQLAAITSDLVALKAQVAALNPATLTGSASVTVQLNPSPSSGGTTNG